MAHFELLVSPPGTGKTTYCVDRFREEIEKSRAGIDSRSYFVLPSREHAARIQNLLLKKGVNGFFNAHVLTLNDLAAQFSGASGACLPAGRRPSPPGSVRASIIRALLLEAHAAGELAYFGRVAEAKGFARALSALFTEMRRGLVTTAAFERLCQPLVSDPVFRLKFRDISVLLKRYEAALAERGYAEPETGFDTGPEKGAAAELVIFDGFYRFTRAQLAVLEAVSKGSRRAIVTLTAADDAAKRPEVFAHVLQTRRRLEAMGFRAGWKPPLAPRAAKAVEILEAPNAREEMRAVAREIRRLYRTESLHWSDCAVILRSVEPYRKTLESAFAEFDVPVHVHERRRLIEQGLAQTAVRLLRLIRDDWREADAAFAARSSFRTDGGDASAPLELVRAARAAGTGGGREAWKKLSAASDLKPAVRSVLENLFKEEEKLRSSRNAGELSRRLRAWLRDLGTAEDALVRSALEDIFERFGRSEAKGDFSITAACEELIDAIEAGLYSEKPRGRNRVQVYDVVMALPKEYKAVFVSGLAEKQFPREMIEEPVLKDAERRAMNERAGETVLEERSSRLAGERYFFYMAVSRARERLTLTYPSAGLDGRPVLPSVFVDDARRMFGDPRLRRTASETASEFWQGEREASLGLAGQEFLRTGPRESAARLDDPASRRQLAALDRPFSPSSLESLAACRFKYFASKLLHLETLPEDREAAEQGTVFHDTLQKFFESLSEDERRDAGGWKDASALAARIDPFLEAEFSANAYFKRVPAYRRRVLLTQMRRAFKRFSREEIELRRERPYYPAYFEKKFGEERPVLVGQLPVWGRIDRIDVSDDGKTAIVVDYKSSKTFFVRRLAKGLELQMPVYWMAAEQELGLRVAGVEHRHLKDGAKPERRGRDEYADVFGKSVWPEAQVQAVLKRTREDAEEAVRAIRGADIAVRPKTCDHCDYSPVCRFEKWKLIYDKPLD